MKAMLSTAPGGPDTLEWTQMPMPEPKKGEVRIAVKAAGVNFPDTLIIQDLYQIKPPRPFAPGGEIAGVVEAVGEGVDTLSEGDRVIATPGFGGFVTHLCVPAEICIPIPDTMPFDEAACFIFTYGTSFYAVKDRGYLDEGQTLLVLGAAGGVGSAAVELGKAMGARVIAAVSSEDKAQFCREIGADETIIYPRDMDRAAQKEFSNKIKELAPKGIDVAYDAVGGAYAEPVIRAMAWNGRFLVVGFPAGIPSIPLNLTLLKSCQIVGVFWGAATRMDPKGHKANLASLFRMHAEGKIKPRVTASYPMEKAAEALHHIADRKVLGKIVVTVD
ncbi:NADPH:quinone oxidoreductase family protein [Aliishimia ponticola]|uniref:NADPH:quinone oxidoreductase family protein n=1 Tax=Aliishimia ponticola TaxID=2499833 RepID=A0A4S4NBD1_9RHOB|nr:NADPH:quinone oxidoreductase family protein [Aliishimia ponticola]THH36706.1 NADPH:quinone oxidoreductase family protein [Aliishimia ponticola]